MNYNDEILLNKPFEFFKQLMYYIACAICIMLIGVLVLVYGFKFKLYEVLSDSQAPYYIKGDLVVVQPTKDVKAGDIIKFDMNGGRVPTTHRLLYIYEYNGAKYYICHGDNVQSARKLYPTDEDYVNYPNYEDDELLPWEVDAAYIQKLIEENHYSPDQIAENARNVQIPNESQVEGIVVNRVQNFGYYLRDIKEHYMLFIALIAGIWCISSTIDVELYIKKCRRLA